MTTGLVVAISIPLVLAMTFLAMWLFDIGLHKISLGALIIALGLLVDEVDTVLALTPDHGALKQLGTKVGVAARRQAPGTGLIRRANREARAFAQAHASITQDPTDLEVRAFAAPVGIAEDPVTGSLNASLAQWLMADGHLPAQYSARQGTVLGRAGQVFLSQDAQGQVWVGGDVVSCITGSVTL